MNIGIKFFNAMLMIAMTLSLVFAGYTMGYKRGNDFAEDLYSGSMQVVTNYNQVVTDYELVVTDYANLADDYVKAIDLASALLDDYRTCQAEGAALSIKYVACKAEGFKK